MAEKKSSGLEDKKGSQSQILRSLNFLFYISKVLGMIPYSLSDYVTHKQFKLSQLGNVFCLVSCVYYCTQYHFLISKSVVRDPETGTLTGVIGIFIIYMEPLMMAIDVLASLINQKSLLVLFDRLQEIDDKLAKENVLLNYRTITKYSIIFVLVTVFGELSLGVINVVEFMMNIHIAQQLLWFVSCIPLIANNVAKTWFLVLILMVKQRLVAINDHLNDTKEVFAEKKLRRVNVIGSNLRKDNLFIGNIGFLEREILSSRNMKIKDGNAWTRTGNRVNDVNIFPANSRGIINVVPCEAGSKAMTKSIMMDSFHLNDRDFLIGDKMDKKLINLCRAHDEICEIAKQVNRMFSFQMLITMAYGFLSITAQFYFLYCGLIGWQDIPTLFRSAQNVPYTVIFLVYTAYKCVVVIYISWKTRTDSQKTGIQLHKIANVVDENHFYNVTNHLSLKLLNHSLNFTACGFFDLDMTTLYGIGGAITSYLIILIQFNLAAKRAQEGNPTAASNGTNASEAVATTVLPVVLNTLHP